MRIPEFVQEVLLEIRWGQTSLAALVNSLAEASPPEFRKKLVDGLRDSVGTALGLNVLKDVLPNLGPDWGACVLAADDKHLPQVLAALAVRPGDKEVDQSLLGGMSLLAGWATVFHNKQHPDQPIRLRTVLQDKVEVKFLAGDKAFPPGVAPAFALKDGYLVVASSPAAIARFKAGAGKAPSGNESPILRLSSTESAKVLRGHWERVIDHIADKNQITREAAALGLEGALSVLDLIDRIELGERAGDGQLTLILRVRPNAR